MESPNEIKAHQRMEKGKQRKVVSCKVELPDDPQEELIKDGRGTYFNWSHQES
jgi:hypothetical protein